jgi:hypothetical protein
MVAMCGHLPFAMAGRRTAKASGERPQPTTRLPFLKSSMILRYTPFRTQVLVTDSSCTVLGRQSVLARCCTSGWCLKSYNHQLRSTQTLPDTWLTLMLPQRRYFRLWSILRGCMGWSGVSREALSKTISGLRSTSLRQRSARTDSSLRPAIVMVIPRIFSQLIELAADAHSQRHKLNEGIL